MKRGLTLFALGALIPMVQGALAPFVPFGLCPNFAFLYVVAIGLCWRNTVAGLVLAAFCGFVADLLSGALFGQHAMLMLLCFVTARFASQHVNLRGARAQIVFVGALTVANALAMGALTAFFSAGAGVLLPGGELWAHAAVNALVAPLLTAWMRALVGRLGDEDGGRRLLRLETRGYLS